MDAHSAPYVVREGDYLAALAHRHGFNPDDAWSDPKNRALNELRQDPNVLSPGDVLYFTRKPANEIARTVKAGSVVQFVVRVSRMKFQIRICDARGQACSGESYVAPEGVLPKTGSLDANSFLNVEVPVSMKAFTVQLPNKNVSIEMRVGHLDPVTEISGVSQRLTQLGYHRGSTLSGSHDPRFVRALCAFQDAEGLVVTGELCEQTAARLEQRFGRRK